MVPSELPGTMRVLSRSPPPLRPPNTILESISAYQSTLPHNVLGTLTYAILPQSTLNSTLRRGAAAALRSVQYCAHLARAIFEPAWQCPEARDVHVPRWKPGGGLQLPAERVYIASEVAHVRVRALLQPPARSPSTISAAAEVPWHRPKPPPVVHKCQGGHDNQADTAEQLAAQGLHILRIFSRLLLADRHVLEHLADLARGADRDRQRAVKLRRVPAHLRQRENVPGHVGDRRVLRVRPNEKRPGNAKPRIGPVIRHAATCEEQSVTPETDQLPTQRRVVPFPEHGDGRGLGDPYEVSVCNVRLAQGLFDTLRLLGLKPGGLHNDDAGRRMVMLPLIGFDRSTD